MRYASKLLVFMVNRRKIHLSRRTQFCYLEVALPRVAIFWGKGSSSRELLHFTGSLGRKTNVRSSNARERKKIHCVCDIVLMC